MPACRSACVVTKTNCAIVSHAQEPASQKLPVSIVYTSMPTALREIASHPLVKSSVIHLHTSKLVAFARHVRRCPLPANCVQHVRWRFSVGTTEVRVGEAPIPLADIAKESFNPALVLIRLQRPYVFVEVFVQCQVGAWRPNFRRPCSRW